MMAEPQGYCFAVFGQQRGAWRATPLEAREDALDAGIGARDEHSGTIYLDGCAEIWVTYGSVTVEPRLVTPPAPPAPYPSRIERIIARREGREAA